MTDEELKEAKRRIAEAEKLANHMQRLREAIGIVTNDGPHQILISVGGHGQPIRHRKNDDDRFSPVCWEINEDGLGDELLQAAISMLSARYERAKAAYDAI